ncbi:MAG: hypothetical protein AAGF12_38735 [Myxococcota bacterium]
MKKKALQVPGYARSVSEPRDLQASGRGADGYPSLWALRQSAQWRSFRQRATAAAASFGLLAASGCADPMCEASSMDELKAHGRYAIDEALDGELSRSVDELKTGLGIHPHPYGVMVAGAVAAPAPRLVEEQEPQEFDSELDLEEPTSD